jgi:L-alanine-DL-glutamate epimerase-like enolase superfamily enzyme
MLAASLRALGRKFRGEDTRKFIPKIADFAKEPVSASAFECAAAQAEARTLGIPLWNRFGGARRSLTTDLTISADSPARVREASREAAGDGFRTLKIKVGSGGLKADLERVLAVHRCANAPRIVLDGNQRLGVSGALRLVERCLSRRVRAVLLEQPVSAEKPDELLACARRCPVPVAADESLRSLDDARELVDSGVKLAFNIKVSKTGLEESRRIAALARAAGLPLMIGCMQESGAGLEPSAALAAGTGWFRFVDLDSDRLLAGGPSGAFVRRGPRLVLR